MTSIQNRKPCAKCVNGKGVAMCNGCEKMFCINHFTEHRDELSKLMDNVSEEHDFLLADLCEENFQHSFLTDIDNWEKESIKRIQTTAERARMKLQQIFNRKKDEIKSSMENLTNELQSGRESADFTEIDISKWMKKLNTLREIFEDWSTVEIEDVNNTESVIHLIKICDQNDQQPISPIHLSDPFIQISEDSTIFDERFDKTDAEVELSEENLVATYHLKRIFSNRYVYGINRYSTGKHSIRFLIEQKGEALLFFGIMTSSKKYDHSFFNPNNSTLHGWYNIESFVISGKSQGYNEKNLLINGDELILIINCDEQQILLQHQRTKRLFQIPIALEKCPLPWKTIVGLSSFNDCIRILP